MILTREEYNNVSENLKYHLDNKLTLSESIFRIGSEAYIELINEARELHSQNKLQLNENDSFIVERLQTGKKGTLTHKGNKRTVDLDEPHIRRKDEPTKNLYVVYRPHRDGKKDPDTGLVKAVTIGFGEDTGTGKPDVRQKHQEEGKRKAFLARHGCAKKTAKDQYSASWWACNMHLFWKQLGLKTNDPW